MKNKEVTTFLDGQKHPFRKEIEQLRNYILEANPELTENLKWNGPNYSWNEADRITMKIQPPSQQAQLIFHRGAAKQAQPKNKLIATKSKILVWKENDRAIITFKSLQEIDNAKSELMEIVNDWINASK
jgi:hypothetical protein